MEEAVPAVGILNQASFGRPPRTPFGADQLRIGRQGGSIAQDPGSGIPTGPKFEMATVDRESSPVSMFNGVGSAAHVATARRQASVRIDFISLRRSPFDGQSELIRRGVSTAIEMSQ